jgi:hypothetical protein
MPLMLIIIYLTLVLLCAAHITNTGQERYWLLIILIPIAGAVFYAVFVVLPGLLNSRRSSGASGFSRGGPARGLRAAERALAVARTPENLFHYAEMLAAEGRHQEADRLLRELDSNDLFASRPRFLLLDAKTHLRLGRYRQALETLERYRARHEFRSQTEALVLCACAYEGLGDFDGADAVYQNSVDRIGGEELRYYYGEFLARNGRIGEARRVFDQLIARVNRMPRFYRTQQAVWVRKARRALNSSFV